MRRNNEKNWMEPAPPTAPFLDPESTIEATAMVANLHERVEKLEEQVLGQFSTLAAHATLAQQAVDQVRAEARADHERLQTTIIGLLDRLRSEINARPEATDGRPTLPPPMGSPVSADATTRLAELEAKTGAVIAALHAVGQENSRLRQLVDELLTQQMRADGWLVSSGSSSDLALR